MSRAGGRLLCTFHLGERLFGVDVSRVREILRRHSSTPVPLAPPAVEGLINLRGEIVTAIDLGRRLGLEEGGSRPRSANVVVLSRSGPVGLLVDDVGDILEVDEEAGEPPPETLRGRSGELVEKVYKLGEDLLVALDVDAVSDVAEPMEPQSRRETR